MEIKKGFTLIELIIVIVIVAILAMVALPRYYANIQKARRAEAVSTLSSIRDAMMCYHTLHGYFPDDFPIEAILEGDTIISMEQPESTGFVYTFDSTTITATRIEGTGDSDYTMNVNSGQISP